MCMAANVCINLRVNKPADEIDLPKRDRPGKKGKEKMYLSTLVSVSNATRRGRPPLSSSLSDMATNVLVMPKLG